MSSQKRVSIMGRRRPAATYRAPHARGFSLVELLIALAIGLLIMASVVTIYVNSSRTSRMSAVESQMNEDGLIALNVIAQQIRMAGYSNFQSTTGVGGAKNFTGAGIRGCSAAAFYPNAAAQPLFANIADADCAAASTYGDGVIVRYEADTRNTFPASGNPSNCLMNSAYNATNSAGGAYFLAENRYYVGSNSTTGTSTMYCAGGSGAMTTVPGYQPILDSVDSMTLLYGIAATNDPADTQIVTYMKAADIDSTFATDPVDLRWGRVISVKICLLMRSAETMADVGATATYRDCSGTLQTMATPDGYMRRAFITTATLRNRLNVTPNSRPNES